MDNSDKNKYIKLIKKQYEEPFYNLYWRDRLLEIEEKYYTKPHPKWCMNCSEVYCVPRVGDAKTNEENKDSLLKCSQIKQGYCYLSLKRENEKTLFARDYESLMDRWDEHFLQHLENRSYHIPHNKHDEPTDYSSIHFLGLQRWNSSSPAMGRSLGGGYLIYHTDDSGCVNLGVAVDPGFDFLRNLFHVGFSLSDIDVLLISHAHVDHVRDFESIVTLLLELKKRKKEKNKVHTILTLGAYKRLEYIFDNPVLRQYVEPYIIDIDKEIKKSNYLEDAVFKFIQEKKKEEEEKEDNADNKKKGKRLKWKAALKNEKKDGLYLEIAAKKAYHNDYSEYSDSFGFIIKIGDRNLEPKEYRLGYSGDTSWYHDIMEQYNECDTIIVHLGSLISRKKEKKENRFDYYQTKDECFRLVREENHPYLMGLLHFITEIYKNPPERRKPLVLVSEFGEEMRGKIRLDLIRRLNETYRSKRDNGVKDNGGENVIDILPVDVGLDILLAEKDRNINKNPKQYRNKEPRVLCAQCEDYVSINNVDFESYGYDEALFCVCKTCRKSTPINVLQDRLRKLYEEGYPLHID